MGRYYNGDIEGKFWFGIQASNDADFFGSEGHCAFLQYHFDDSQIKDVEKGIAKCKRELIGWVRKLDKFFKENNGYNDEMLMNSLKTKDKRQNQHLLEWYARLHLGKEILKCLKEHKYCSFEAEV